MELATYFLPNIQFSSLLCRRGRNPLFIQPCINPSEAVARSLAGTPASSPPPPGPGARGALRCSSLWLCYRRKVPFARAKAPLQPWESIQYYG